MRIYVASIVFWAGNLVDHFSATATSNTYESLNTFIAFCELSAMENKFYPFSNTLFNVTELAVLSDGTLRQICNCTSRWDNYDETRASEYISGAV
jgi:hypothetical protein